MSAAKRLRCAIYTRKSSEEGLEQEFNSLDAQREACEAFIASQAGLGWKLIPNRYDDGGISGGTLARPALQQLLEDVRNGQIDVVVVYKIDRLTRSLTDFAKIVEVFDERSVSFVSVTQSFNTTSSMGRLTLNVLLSFAQFEREVTSERIRDKIAASKKKGMWMGGQVPLGYNAQDRKLTVNSSEATTVRHLFTLYLEIGSLRSLEVRAQQLGLKTKQRTSRSGQIEGGLAFSCGHLRAILTNPIYVSKIRQGKELYQGQHQPIVNQHIFDAVQARLASRANTSTTSSGTDGLHLLTGLIFDESGDRLSPTHAAKGAKRYRYYVSRRSVTTSQTPTSKPWRLPANQVERVVQDELVGLLTSQTQLLDVVYQGIPKSTDIALLLSAGKAVADKLQSSSIDERKLLISDLVRRIIVNTDHLSIELDVTGLLRVLGCNPDESLCNADNDLTQTLAVPIALRRRGIEMKLVLNNKTSEPSQADTGLLELLRRAHHLLRSLTDGTGLTMAELAAREHLDISDLSRIIRFAFLAPDLCKAIIEARQPVEWTKRSLFRLPHLPYLWAEQRILLKS